MSLSANPQRIKASSAASIARPASRTWIATLVIGVVIGIGVGAILGAVISSVQSTVETASAFVRIAQPIDLAAVAAGTAAPQSQADAEGYVSGEAAYLSGDGFARAVGEQLGDTESAELAVVQNASSSVLTVTGSAATSDDAVKIVQAAIDVYRQQLAQRTDQQLQAVLPAVDQLESSAVAATDFVRAQDVRDMRSTLLLLAGQSGAIEVLQPPTTAGSTSQQWLIGAIFGGLLGGLLVVLGLSAYRNRSGRIRSATDLAEIVDGFILPAVDLRKTRTPRHGSRQRDATLARTLFAQCSGPAPSPTIVLVGASPSSGTGVVASLLGFAAAEHGAVECVTLTATSAVLPRSTDREATRIIVVGAIGDSALMAEAIAVATTVIVVARLDADTVPQVLTVRSATADSQVQLTAVFTHRPWWSFTSENGAETKNARTVEAKPDMAGAAPVSD